MKLLGAFLRLVRWQNLLFIVLTQCLFFFFVFGAVNNIPVYRLTNDPLFYILMAASVCIAAAGYIINDYFDMHIDAINKPGKVVVDRMLRRRWAIAWHLVLSFIGIILSLYFGWRTRNVIVPAGNIACVLLLWFYSTTFKKKLLVGNIIISGLTAWVILVIYFGWSSAINRPGYGAAVYDSERSFFKMSVLYAGFAFIVSLVREVIKDLEDMEGDMRYNCRTMPVVWGVPASKVFSAVWLLVCIGALSIVQIYAWKLGWRWSVIYGVLLIIIPLLMILKGLYPAAKPAEYHRLSSWVKLVMLTGILSMIFFLFT